MIIHPKDILLWTFRRKPQDIVRLYNELSGIMCLATGGTSLNFGLWDNKCNDPLAAQHNMATYAERVAELHNNMKVADVGCGFADPARIWRERVPDLHVTCVDVNYRTLSNSRSGTDMVNGSAMNIPLASHSVDVVLALESAQHFYPLSSFATESARILKSGGMACLFIPIIGGNYTVSKLRTLYLTWSSERYDSSTVRQSMRSAGFKIIYENMVGSQVYEPLAAYYMKHRHYIRQRILSQYPGYVEWILYRSLQDMKWASEHNVIDYMIMKCKI